MLGKVSCILFTENELYKTKVFIFRETNPCVLPKCKTAVEGTTKSTYFKTYDYIVHIHGVLK